MRVRERGILKKTVLGMVATFCVQLYILTEISRLLAGQVPYVSIDSVSATCPIMHVTNWLPCYI